MGNFRKLEKQAIMRKLLKLIKVLSIIIVIFIGFSAIAFSNFTGYCEEEGKVLTAEELITKDKKRQKIYEDNPYCCSVERRGWMESDLDMIFNRLLGYYRNVITVFYKRDNSLVSDKASPYYKSHQIVNECGKITRSYGITISEESYQDIMNSRKKNNAQESNNASHHR